MAPKGTKRPAAASESAAKKPKIGKQISSISQAIESTDLLPATAATMLASATKGALSDYADVRHPIQGKFVEMLKKTLGDIQSSYQKVIDEEQTKVSGAEAEKASRQASVDAASKVTEAKAEVAKEKKDAEKAAIAVKKAADDTLKDAKKAQKDGDAVLAGVTKRKDKLEQVKSEMYTPLKDGTADATTVEKAIKKLVATLQKDFGFDKTLLETLPPALARPAAERGHFDGMVLFQVEEEFQKRLTEFQATLTEGEPAKAARTAAVTEAEAAVAAAAEKVTAATAEKETADTAEEEADKVLKDATKVLKDFDKDYATAVSTLEGAQKVMGAFSEGALAAFTELSERTTPPPEPEVPAEEAAPAEPAAAAP